MDGREPVLTADSGESESGKGLARVLGLRDLTLLIIGSVIGSGIFLKPGGVLHEVGNSVTIALSVWLVGGVLSLLGALTYGEMGAMNPKAGGLYVFVRDGFGRLPAFLYGWALFAVINSAGIAALTVAFSSNLARFIPLSPVAQKAVSVIVIAILAAVNVWGTRKSADLQNWTTAIKAGGIVLMSVVLLIVARGSIPAASTVPPPSGSLMTAFGVAMISVLWAYEGWQSVTYSAGETINAGRNFPFAMLIGTIALIFIYLLANVAYSAALGPAGLAASDNAAASSLGVAVGSWAASVVTLVILISVFSAANSSFLTGSRVYYAMAKDGLFFRRLSEVHPVYGTPALAVVAGALWSAILAVSGTFDQLTAYVVFAGWIFYALGAAAVFRYRKLLPDAERPYRVIGYPWTPIAFILAALFFVANIIYAKPAYAAVGLGLVLLGLPAYAFWSRPAKPNPAKDPPPHSDVK